jgi:hypothetical protein
MQRNHEMMQMLKLDLMTELHSSIETMLQKNLLKPTPWEDETAQPASQHAAQSSKELLESTHTC